MCQTCVDNGFISQDVYDRIAAFNRQYDNLQHGPAHVVLADCNVDDRNLVSAIGMLRTLLLADRSGHHLKDNDRYIMELCNWYPYHRDPEQLQMTIAFLEELLAIPVESRIPEECER